MAVRRSLAVLLCTCAVTFALGVSAVGAQEARAVGVTPPRLSFVDGDVSYWRPGADDWVDAQVNTALGAGDSLYAGDGGNVELEIGTRAYVRAGSGTQLGVESLETGYLQLRVPAGHAAVDLERIPEGQEIEVDTPNGAFLIEHVGYYRFDVDDQATRFSARRGGMARVVPAGGDEAEVGSSQQIVVSGTETAELQRIPPAADDAWDRWNSERTAGLSEEPRSAQYVSPEVAGVDDLDRYGDWRDTPTYGHVWMPRSVASDWSPYSTGRWVWDGYYGWTWVDDAPWGWAPYHYGRWCYVDGYWGWAPGPVVARPVYAPALVAFFGGGSVGVSVSVGTPFVSWVPLGWGEPVVPWWGPRGFVGRPYWGGWGGPRVVNNTVINNTTIVNVNNLDRYSNARHRNAVIGVAGDHFGRGRIAPVRVDADRVRNLRPVRGELGVRPVQASLVPRETRGQRPPDSIRNRRVVATRAPQDPARLPRSNGLVRTDQQRHPEPRIVAPRNQGVDRMDRGGGRNAPPPRGLERDSVERTHGASDRAPRERDRNGRNLGTSVERQGGDRGATPPPRGGAKEPARGLGGADETSPPPRSSHERPNDRIQQPGMERRDQGSGRDERPAHTQQNEAPDRGRIERPAPPSRVEQPKPQQRNESSRPRNEPREMAPPRSSGGGGGGHGMDRQRMEQPQERQMEAPREMPRTDPQSRHERSSSGRDAGGGSNRESSQRGPATQREPQPRSQHQVIPHVERGAGGDARPGQPRGGKDGGSGDRHRDH